MAGLLGVVASRSASFEDYAAVRWMCPDSFGAYLMFGGGRGRTPRAEEALLSILATGPAVGLSRHINRGRPVAPSAEKKSTAQDCRTFAAWPEDQVSLGTKVQPVVLPRMSRAILDNGGIRKYVAAWLDELGALTGAPSVQEVTTSIAAWGWSSNTRLIDIERVVEDAREAWADARSAQEAAACQTAMLIAQWAGYAWGYSRQSSPRDLLQDACLCAGIARAAISGGTRTAAAEYEYAAARLREALRTGTGVGNFLRGKGQR